METITDSCLGPLYHGTRNVRGRRIVREGFRRSASCSYTGTGVCLSESLTVAYEYGEYEAGGCVLEAWIAPSARWSEGIKAPQGRFDVGEAYDRFFECSGNDAAREFGGNVWVVWNPAVLVAVRRLTPREALRRLCAEFEEDGPDCGYNGVASDYASLWWGRETRDPNITRFPEHLSALRQRLQRLVGWSRSERVAAAAQPG